MSDYQRARSPEQKAERMAAIMDAAQSLFEELPYHEINMGLIAKELGWSRSNLYKYASTQEEVFLALHTRACAEFISDLVERLANAPIENDEFAEIWASATEDHIDFLRYQDILIAIIESNASLDKLVEFKRSFAEMIPPLIDVISRQLDCDEDTAQKFYFTVLYQAPGLYNHFNCAERTAEAMRIVGMKLFKGDFKESYTSFIMMCLQHYSNR